jgi:hypothetical protein
MGKIMSTASELVRQWHEALNQGDLATVMNLVHDDVVVGGPRGTASGAALVREWFGRANVRLYPLIYFANGQTVVVEQNGEWLDPASGEVTGQQRVSTHFVVAEGLITHIARYDQLEDALSEAGLTISDRA